MRLYTVKISHECKVLLAKSCLRFFLCFGFRSQPPWRMLNNKTALIGRVYQRANERTRTGEQLEKSYYLAFTKRVLEQ